MEEPGADSPRVPADVAVVSWLVLVMALVDLPHVLWLVLGGVFQAWRFVADGAFFAVGFLVLPVVSFAVTTLAAYEVRELRPWARWWLVLQGLLILTLIALHPPDADELQRRWRQWQHGGWSALTAVHWMAHVVVPLVPLAVLARRRQDFPPLAARGRGALAVGFAVVAGGFVLMGELRERAMLESRTTRATSERRDPPDRPAADR